MKAKGYFFISLLGLFFIACGQSEQSSSHTKSSLQPQKSYAPFSKTKEAIQAELASLDTDAYVENYIIKIINEGSSGTLGFKGGSMDARIATKEDAPNIARYVMLLANRQSSDDALGRGSELFYTSNCGGCHSNDGKGMGGIFPDLTLRTYVGIQKQKALLIDQLNSTP